MARPSRRQARGQVGIGTVIVLIAVLLVAVTTVGVFFEVAGSLQSDTATAGEGASDRLTGRLEVVAVAGTVQDGTVEVVNVTVGQSSATGTTDLREATVQWVGPAGADALTWAGETDGPSFGLATVRDDDGSGPVLNSEVDRVTMTIDPGTGIDATTTVDGRTVDIEETGPALEPGDEVEVAISTDGTVRYRIQVPLSLSQDGTVDL